MSAVAGHSVLKYNAKSALQHLTYLLTVSKCPHSEGEEQTLLQPEYNNFALVFLKVSLFHVILPQHTDHNFINGPHAVLIF